MAHVFDPKNISRLESAERQKELPPKETLLDLGLRLGDIFVDIGVGIGYFAIPAAEIAGASGKIIGIDTSNVMLDECKKRIPAHLGGRITLKQADDSGVVPGIERADMVFMCNVLHEIDDKPRALNMMRKMLKPTGKIVIIDWKKEEMPHGPPLSDRLPLAEVLTLVEKGGFSTKRYGSIGESYYFVEGILDTMKQV